MRNRILVSFVIIPLVRICQKEIIALYRSIASVKQGFKYLSYFQVETELFPDMAESQLYLRSVDVDEILVQEYMEQAVEIVKLNSTGPQK